MIMGHDAIVMPSK